MPLLAKIVISGKTTELAESGITFFMLKKSDATLG